MVNTIVKKNCGHSHEKDVILWFEDGSDVRLADRF